MESKEPLPLDIRRELEPDLSQILGMYTAAETLKDRLHWVCIYAGKISEYVREYDISKYKEDLRDMRKGLKG